MQRELIIALEKEEIELAVLQFIERMTGDKVKTVNIANSKLGEVSCQVFCETKSPKPLRKKREKRARLPKTRAGKVLELVSNSGDSE